jgi:quinol monooxygenase YgiN
MVKLIARIDVQPGQGGVVGAALKELAIPSRQEAGCILYDVCRATESPDTLLVLEEWESKEILDAHMQTPHFGAFIEKVGSLLAGEPTIHFIERL